LALDITVGLDTPYDKVIAITNYLRENITYSETVPNQPPRQDSVDWFLFDIRQGFCNYYATAEIILLRSLGIPARWAVGFAQGERLEDGNYLVRQRDAHAWPEVYFPGLGWVEFEPTASQPVLSRPPGEASASEEGATNSDPELEAQRLQELAEELALLRERQFQDGRSISNTQAEVNIVYWVVPLAIGVFLLALAWQARQRYNLAAAPIYMEKTLIKIGIRPPPALRAWARRAALEPLAKAYLEINHALSRLGNRPPLTATPGERATTLIDILPDAARPIHQLIGEYEVATFSTQPADLPAARKAGDEIRKLSYKALLQRLLARLQRPPNRVPSWYQRQR
jgi:hypothetical protein